MKLAVLFHRLGPYHHARLYALSELCQLTAIEFSRVDSTYSWATESAERAYPIVTLFEDRDVMDKSATAMTHRMNEALQRIRPDVVAIPGWSSPPALAALDWCLRTLTPAVLMSDSTEHDEPRRWWREAFKARVVQTAAAALVGGSLHRNYISQLGMPVERVYLGYDVVDNTFFSAGADAARGGAVDRSHLGLPQAFFLASNRFIEKKNLPSLLKAFDQYLRRAGEDAWHLVILGDGPLRGKLESIIQECDLTGWVHLPGFQQYAALPDFYGFAGAFVHASTTEQWGLVVNEAMAAGLPVLVSDRCGCAPELVSEGENGFTFGPLESEELTERMLFIAADACDRGAMGRRSREIIRNWSPEIFAEGLMSAAKAALLAPRPVARWWTRTLLWALIRR